MRLLKILSLTLIMISCAERKPETTNSDTDETLVKQKGESFVVFQRDTVIYSKLGHNKEKQILIGYNPSVSPDGRKLTFLKYEGEAREIFLVDLTTMNETRLNVDSDNFFGATWSRDGKYIAFNVWDDGDWAIGVIKSDNTGFTRIKGQPGFGLYEPTWSPDSKSIIAHNLIAVFEFNLDGTEVQKIDVGTLGEDISLSSDNRFWISEDKDSFFFNAGVSEGMAGVEGSVYAILYFNMRTGELLRLSPQKMHARELYMTGENKLIFSAAKENEQQSNIYSYDIELRKLTQIIKNGTTPSGSIRD
jgi:TolB protein